LLLEATVALQTLTVPQRQATEAVTSVDTDGLDVTLPDGAAIVLLRVTNDCSWRWSASDDLMPLPKDTWLSLPAATSASLAASQTLHVRADSSAATVYLVVS